MDDTEGKVREPDGTTLTIVVFTHDAYAYYGVPASEQEQAGAYCWKPYPRQYWKQIASLH